MKDKLEKYLSDNLNNNSFSFFGAFAKKSEITSSLRSEEVCDFECSSINDYIDRNKEDSFQSVLFSFIDKSGLTDSEVYNKVNIDRRLFSKIRNENYHPSKETVILLGIALKLSEEEIEDLLHKASYSLPKNNVYDLIIRFCFKEKIYDLDKINEFLYDHNFKVLRN